MRTRNGLRGLLSGLGPLLAEGTTLDLARLWAGRWPEIADRTEVRPVQRGHCLKVQLLLAAPDLPRGIDAAAVRA